MAGPAELRKQEIVAALAAARSRLSATGGALHRSLDVPARATESFQHHRPAWLSGAAIVGFVLSKLPSRKKTVFIERTTGKVLGAAGKLGTAGKLGALYSAAKLAISIARPLISELRGSALGEILKRFHRPAKPDRPDKHSKP